MAERVCETGGRVAHVARRREPWLIVAGGFHRRGGMDKANAALAAYLAEGGTPVQLVAHEVEAELRSHPLVSVRLVQRPAGSTLLGERLLDRQGRAAARELVARWPAARVVVNGGNCLWADVNWVHSVHHAWPTMDEGAPAWFRVKNRFAKSVARSRERRALASARVVVANSERTRRDLVEHLGLDSSRVRTVYLGSDERGGAVTFDERSAARRWLSVDGSRPLVAFVGALGHDGNKGFETLLRAWKKLCSQEGWDAELVAAGGGRGSETWERRVLDEGLAGRVRLLGFTERVGEVLAASDLLVSPVRYEAYGLNVHEAIARGVPALVSASAGVAERYGEELGGLLLRRPWDADELAEKLSRWRASVDEWRRRFAPLGERLRARSWAEMAAEFVSLVEEERSAAVVAA